ncbi:MAG: thiamine pyrophosphate-binding protein [Planctomycetota bacterium]
MTAADFLDSLASHGFTFATGVPCSIFKGILREIEVYRRIPYVPAVREDAALGMAVGAWLGGKAPVVFMQNSGLGTGLNALQSLVMLYRAPVLLVVSWRGKDGMDSPEHALSGATTPDVLKLCGIPHRVFGEGAVKDPVAWAAGEMNARQGSVAILVPEGVLLT